MIPGFPWRYVAAAAVGALLVALLVAGARAALAREHAAGHAEGRAQVQALWDAHQAQQVAAQAAADRERAAEGFRQFRNVERVRENDLKIQQARAVADAGARDELSRLRGQLAAAAARDRAAQQSGDPSAAAGAYAAAEKARGLLDECASEYQRLGEEAGGLARQLIGLQGYVQGVIASPAPESTTTPR